MKPQKRLGKDDWIDLGLRQLAAHGASGITLDALCAAAGRTKGSFYHHFTDHDAFISDMMHAWKKKHTQDITTKLDQLEHAERRQELSDLANSLDHKLEVAIRQFAQGNKAANLVLAEVDTARVAFVADLYVQQGVARTLADELARIEYAGFVGAQIIWPDLSFEERMKLDRRFSSLVTAALDQPDQ